MLTSSTPLRQVVWLGDLTHFALRSSVAACAVVRHPIWCLRAFHGMLIGGLPLAGVAGLALGIVIWFHTRDVLERTGTGAVEYLPTFLSAAVLLELAPVGAGLILAARTGASLGAEFAAMKVGEQLDAVELLGVSPIRRLIGPRILAAMLAVPILHIVIATVALLGGFGAETLTGQTTALKYQTAAIRELYLIDVVPAFLKTIVFGWVVGTLACFCGLRASEGAEGVGKAATDSVVLCSLTVLAADVVLVAVIHIGQSLV